MNSFYGDRLQGMLTDPSQFQGSPGFQFALGTGLDAAKAQMAQGGMDQSGNALARLTQLGTGYATQDFGNTADRLGHLNAQEQNYDLGNKNFGVNMFSANNNFADANARNATTNQNDWWGQNNQGQQIQNQFALGQGRNNIDWFGANTQRGNAMTNNWQQQQTFQANHFPPPPRY